MMNKRRTKEIGRTKYLMFLPLAAILMIVSNIEMVARTTEKFAKEMMGQITEEVAMQAETTNIPELSTREMQEITLPQGTKEKEVTETQIKSVPDSVVFQVVEEMPDFPGGMKALMDYLSKNVKYPAEAHAIGAQGRVIVSFTVKKDGSIADTKVERSVNPYLDKEAMRVIAAMPKWQPGKHCFINIFLIFICKDDLIVLYFYFTNILLLDHAHKSLSLIHIYDCVCRRKQISPQLSGLKI